MLQVVSKKTRKKMTEKREENEGFPEPGGKNDNRENGIRKQLLKKQDCILSLFSFFLISRK